MSVVQSVNEDMSKEGCGPCGTLAGSSRDVVFAYRAKSSREDIEMTITHSMQNGMTGTLGAAIALGAEEPLIERLEEWLNFPLDFAPVPDESRSSPAPKNLIKVTLRVPESFNGADQSNNSSVQLSVPLTLLKHCSRPDWMALDVEWQSILSELVLSRFTLSDLRIQSITTGSILLVPNAFKPSWHISIRSVDDLANYPLSHECELDSVQAFIRFMSPEGVEHNASKPHFAPYAEDINKSPSAQLPIEICTQTPLSFPSNFLLGWTGDHEVCVPLDAVNENPGDVLERVRIKLDGETFAEGTLVPVADGWGVLVSQLL